MHYLSLAVAVLLGAATLASADKRPCGFKIAPCPAGEVCEKVDPSCDRGENCAGFCVPETPKPPRPRYPSCGGYRVEPVTCPEADQLCIDDPYANGCGMACDLPGICVTPVFCGGFAGIQCEDGKMCIDDPRDDCDPMNGGADCGGICV
ncbi:hypothetical protein MFIFM68171_03964 [Madurella fahalii]|uniref:Uncharacterized protein n=1 Tax=Madurella fahalii TaxID=1157608 RepID=A0ABQ0G7W7_9PEZI